MKNDFPLTREQANEYAEWLRKQDLENNQRVVIYPENGYWIYITTNDFITMRLDRNDMIYDMECRIENREA